MPQLDKGGKHTYGWSRVGEAGRITIPPEALTEYRLQESEKLIVIPGSRTSGGFGLASLKSVKRSPIGAVVNVHPELGKYRVAEGEVVEHKGKSYCWVELNNGGVAIPPATLERYGVRIGNRLLVIRGSGLAIGFAVRGPIVEEAEKHSELEEI
jgi:bifunctional DNA-binding transcriptional regulator/antitoxin component of YhaV-PrlF toxin-antitoxin module